MALGFSRFGKGILVAGALVGALGLSACGVKGPLEPPPAKATVGQPDGMPPGQTAEPQAKKSFFLDPLI